jgi:diaminohydroxyphosphoribosylaminopyrimidine deaminase/5-amino-6-(5-phosphoribosylamino)uracil reductase
MESQHEIYMQMALDLAAKGTGHTSPNPMVGAVLVKEGHVVGRGYHQRAGEAHAEVNAIDDAGDQAKGATIYVTLEPCNHTGRTPPCTQKILAAGITQVVVATGDPNPGVTGGGNAYLRAHGIAVIEGVLEEKGRRLIEDFAKHASTGRPFVNLKWAATLDGRIATRSGDSKWITGDKARAYGHGIRHKVDAILVGVGTIHADNPSLTARLENGTGVDPRRIILDTRLSIDEGAKVLHQASMAPTYLVVGPGADSRKRDRLESDKVRFIEAPLKAERIDIDALLNILGAKNIISLLIEGGSKVSASALAAGIVDKVYLFYAPKILGGDDGVPVCRGAGPRLMAQSLVIDKIAVHRFGDDFMIEGYPRQGRPD